MRTFSQEPISTQAWPRFSSFSLVVWMPRTRTLLHWIHLLLQTIPTQPRKKKQLISKSTLSYVQASSKKRSTNLFALLARRLDDHGRFRCRLARLASCGKNSRGWLGQFRNTRISLGLFFFRRLGLLLLFSLFFFFTRLFSDLIILKKKAFEYVQRKKNKG